MADTITIPKRFNGPLENGNGGYCSGVVAQHVEGGRAEVSLRRPVPLDTPLVVARQADGSAQLLEGDALVAEGRPVAELDLDVPAPVSLDDAATAMEGYRGLHTGPFSHCFVCGLAREDAYGVFAGRVGDRDVVASRWTPPPSAAGEDGKVRAELVWSVLDCPTYFATYVDEELALAFLARFAVRIDAPVAVGEDHVVIAWPLGADGRKRRAASAVLNADGETLAIAEALLVEPRA
jgi:hypothetical protein